MNKSAKDLQLALDAEEAWMRRALGLDKNSNVKPKPPKPHKVALQRKTEVALRCFTKNGDEVTFYHYENTVSALLAECEAKKVARKKGLEIIYTVSVEMKDVPITPQRKGK